MKAEEANKLLVWLAACYPSFAPSKQTTAIWARELPNISAADAMKAVRRWASENSGGFPPNLFQVANMFNPDSANKKNEAVAIFGILWRQSSGMQISEEDERRIRAPAVVKALDIFGEDLSRCETIKRDFYERRFVSIYLDCLDREAHNQLAIQGASVRKIAEK